MIFYFIGVDYKDTPLGLREKAYYLRDEIRDFFKARVPESEALFTCNRIEIYVLDCDAVAMIRTLQTFQSTK